MRSFWGFARSSTVITSVIIILLIIGLWLTSSREYNDNPKSASIIRDDFRSKRPSHETRNSGHLVDRSKLGEIGPFDFRSCTMMNCFNLSRCLAPGSMRVGIVQTGDIASESANRTLGESNLIHEKILDIIKRSRYFEPDQDKACILVLEDDTLDRDPLSQSFRPELKEIFGKHNNYGMNHLIFNLYSGTWPNYRENDFSGLQFGAALLAKASNSEAYHRDAFDISLPLFSYLHPDFDSELNNPFGITDTHGRSLFLTFKGKRYVFGSGSETRNSVYHIDNRRDIIMLTTCRHGKKWRESSDVRCASDENRYDEFDYIELMKESKFCLIPRGRRLGSFRFLEALSYGCIPVILSDGWVKPFDEIIDWSRAALQFNESQLLLVGELLRDFTETEIDEMRTNGLYVYRQHLSTKQRIILTTLSIIEERIKNMISFSTTTRDNS